MKKTVTLTGLIISFFNIGMVMAWTTSGTGGSSQFTGFFVPQGNAQTWEVSINSAINLGDMGIKPGATTASIHVSSWIPLLGIRTAVGEFFGGGPGLSPQIDFNGAVDLDGFNSGETTLTLPIVNSADNSALGTLSGVFISGSEVSFDNKASGSSGKFQLFSATSGDVFYGGLPKEASKIVSNAWALAGNYSSAGHREHYVYKGSPVNPSTERFIDSLSVYNGFYTSAIKYGSKINLSLTSAMGIDVVEWKASMPITIIYN